MRERRVPDLTETTLPPGEVFMHLLCDAHPFHLTKEMREANNIVD
jgi:hypothetical protein